MDKNLEKKLTRYKHFIVAELMDDPKYTEHMFYTLSSIVLEGDIDKIRECQDIAEEFARKDEYWKHGDYSRAVAVYTFGVAVEMLRKGQNGKG